jgi:hypothetical protein
MARSLRILPLLFLPLLSSASCGDDGGAAAGDAAPISDASVPGDATSPDGSAPDASAVDSATSDSGTTTPDAGATVEGGAQDSTAMLLWSATFQVYLQSSLDVLVMSTGKPAGTAAPISVMKVCPEAGSTLIVGTVTTDAMGRTVSDLTMTFDKCKVNGLIIEGKWAIKQDTVVQVGGNETYAGDLSYSGLFTRTCATMTKRVITPTAQTLEGMFCGVNAATWR